MHFENREKKTLGRAVGIKGESGESEHYMKAADSLDAAPFSEAIAIYASILASFIGTQI
jgi:hypothetical protein